MDVDAAADVIGRSIFLALFEPESEQGPYVMGADLEMLVHASALKHIEDFGGVSPAALALGLLDHPEYLEDLSQLTSWTPEGFRDVLASKRGARVDAVTAQINALTAKTNAARYVLRGVLRGPGAALGKATVAAARGAASSHARSCRVCGSEAAGYALTLLPGPVRLDASRAICQPCLRQGLGGPIVWGDRHGQ
jgi:hypothetical protein